MIFFSNIAEKDLIKISHIYSLIFSSTEITLPPAPANFIL